MMTGSKVLLTFTSYNQLKEVRDDMKGKKLIVIMAGVFVIKCKGDIYRSGPNI